MAKRFDHLALDRNAAQGLTRFTQRLIQTPSPSGQEDDIAQLIVEHLRELGFKKVRVNAMGSVVATLGSGVGPTLLYDAHMDTVMPVAPQHWTHPPFAAALDGDRLYGLGAVDTKGALASMIYGARQLLPYQNQLKGKLVLALVVQEEPCEGLALRVLVEEDDILPDYVLLGEPTDLQISCGHRGRVMFKITVTGRSSHGSRPDLGRNAVYAAARLVFAIQLLAGDLPRDSFLGPGTIAVTGIESQGAGLNAIPDLCKIYVDRRLTLGETVMSAQAQLESLISREEIPASVKITVYDEPSYTGFVRQVREAHPAWALPHTHPFATTLSRTIQAISHTVPAFKHWPFSTDGVYSMGRANIPTLGFGPGNPDLVHTSDEHVRPNDLKMAAQVYAALAAGLLLDT